MQLQLRDIFFSSLSFVSLFPIRHVFAIQDGRNAQPLWLPAERFVRRDKKKKKEKKKKKREIIKGALSRQRPIVAPLDHIVQLNLLFYASRTCVTCTRNHRVHLKASSEKKRYTIFVLKTISIYIYIIFSLLVLSLLEYVFTSCGIFAKYFFEHVIYGNVHLVGLFAGNR